MSLGDNSKSAICNHYLGLFENYIYHYVTDTSNIKELFAKIGEKNYGYV